MNRFFTLVVLLLFCSITGNGQNRPEFFKTIPSLNETTPDWAKMMYSDDPDVWQVEFAYHKFYKNNSFEKNIHTQNFKFWWRRIVDFIDENGKIRTPSTEEEVRLLKKIKAKKVIQQSNHEALKTPGTWTSIGPLETYSTGSSGIPVSWQANVYAIDQSQSNPDILYAGSESGGIFKTIDRGLNWTLVSKEETFVTGMLCVKIHPDDPNIVYVGGNNRIYKTTDGGSTWSEMLNIGTSPQRILIHQTNHDTVFCAANNGFRRSYDGGASWATVFTETCYDVESHPTNHDTIYLTKNDDAEKRSELFRSLDGGLTWMQQTSGWYSPTVLAEARNAGARIAVTPASPDLVYVALIGEAKANDTGWIGIYKSTDAGATWANPNLPDGGPYIQTTHPNLATQNWDGTSFTQGFYNFGFAASHTNANRLWVGNLSLYETSDGGLTWTPLGGYASGSRLSYIHPDIQDIHVLGNDVWVATDGGINYSNDELQSHSSRKYGLIGSNYWGFGSGWNEDVLVGGRYHNGNSGYYQTYGIGNTLRLGGGEAPTGYVDPLKERTGYFSDIDTKKIPTTLSGEVISSPKLSIYPNSHYIEAYSSELEFHPAYAARMYLGKDDGFWKSTDGGANFSKIGALPTDSRVLEFEISRSNPQVMYAVVKDAPGGSGQWGQIYKTTDGGSNWTATTGLPANNRRRLQISINPTNENELWVSSNNASNGGKVYKTTNGGVTWINMTTASLDNESIKDIQYIGGATAEVYVSTDFSVYYFNKNTNAWVSFDTDLPFKPRPLQMRPFFKEGKLRMATYGRGIWETELFDNPAPLAQPMTYTDTVFCSRDTVQLDCYSILNHNGASWLWSVSPASTYISSTSARNPKIVLGGSGNYSVTLTVTDGSGTSSTKTINNMIVVDDQCAADTIPGQALKTVSNGDYFIARDANLTDITNLTITAWIKPDGAQEIGAGIVSDGQWCFHCKETQGFVYNYNGNRLWYRWPGNESNWGSNSGLDVPDGEWTYVALVIYPDSAVIYRNEDRYVHVKALEPGNIYNLYVGHGHYSRSFHGDMDEVSVWNRSLAQNEIRELRHLSKAGIVPTDPNLISYYQFNKLVGGTQIMDVGGTNHGVLNAAASLTPSAVPVGAGASQRLAVSSSALAYDFPSAGAKLFFNDCQPPSGEMVVSRLRIPPNINPNANSNGNNYWLLNFYGDNNSDEFSFLDSLELTPASSNFVSGLADTSDAVLHHRRVHSIAGDWSTVASAKKINTGALAFNRAIRIDSSVQIVLTNQSAAFAEITPEDYCQPDTLAEKALECFASGDYVQTPDFNQNSDSLTISAWIKPDRIQENYSGIVISDGATGGINFRESNNTLGYHWNGGWSWDSNLEAPINEWSHVAMVVAPGSVILYLNGVAAVHTRTPGNLNFSTAKIGSYKGWGSRNFDGQIDEVCIWKRSLSQNEIRDLLHLTKDKIVPSDTSLIAYYQFNETASTVFDKSKKRNHSSFGGNAALVNSTAPVGGGVSERKTVNSGGAQTFSNTGITLGFPTSGTFPDGEVMTYKINSLPDSLPTDFVVADQYWIVRNYGSNSTFTALDSIVFSEVKSINAIHKDSTHLFNLYKRSSNQHLNNWTNEDGADLVTGQGNNKGKISFNTGNGQTEFSQYAVSDGRGVRLSAKAYLEGAYVGGMMTDKLRTGNYLPVSEPYSGLGYVHQNGGGKENCESSIFVPFGNDAIVDWVVLELRDKNNSSSVQYTRTALIQADGDIVDTDGTSPVLFRQAAPGDYYVAVRHRNHLGAMLLNPISLSAASTTVDFTSITTYGTDAQKDLGGGVMGLWAADLNASGNIDSGDRTEAWSARNLKGYRVTDVDMNGTSDAGDRSRAWNNRNRTEQLP